MIVLYGFLLLLLILLFSRYGVDLRYSEKQFSLRLHFSFFSFFRIQLLNKSEEKSDEKGEEKSETPRNEKPPKEKRKLTLPPLQQLPELAELAVKTLGRFFRALEIDVLKLHLSIGTRDPYDTAMSLNYANAAAEILFNTELLRVKKLDVIISPDFVNEEITLDGRLLLTVRLYKLIAVRLALFVDYRRWKHQQKKTTTEEERN